MHIYFVRHADTGLVKQNIAQFDNSPLNELGLTQAQALASRLSAVNFDKIISSPLTRATQTARAITTNFITSDLFCETKKPTEIVGKNKLDPKVRAILDHIGDMYLVDPTWHYSDEENFEDLKSRASRALQYLISQDCETVLVVSHANFIALMVALMIFGDDFSVSLSLKWKKFLRLNNTGICRCTYEEGRWKLQSWNDSSHLDSIISNKLVG